MTENYNVEPLAIENPVCSTDEVWYKDNQEISASQLFDGLTADVAALEAGKADASHTHTEYAAASHSHTGYAASSHTHTGFAAESHTHSEYAETGHTHSDYAATSHAHTDYAPVSHEHTGYASTDHTHISYSGASASTYKLVYVGVNGNDANTGASQSSPMATVKGAIRKYAENYKFLDIRLLDGTYNEDLGAIGVDIANLSIRSVSEDNDAVVINMATHLDLNSGHVRLYNMTLNVTETGVRGLSVNAGELYAYGMKITLPTASTMSCVNVYNGAQAFLMNCVLNSGTGTSAGAAIYGNQALLIKAINCTSERTVNVGFHAHNGSDIWYTDTITATTKTKVTSWGKCTAR